GDAGGRARVGLGAAARARHRRGGCRVDRGADAGCALGARGAAARVRVLHVTDNYAPATGGLERAVAALAQGLAADGHAVDVVTMARPDAPAHEREGAVAVHRVAGWTRHLRRFSTDPGHHFHPTVPDPALARRLQEL